MTAADAPYGHRSLPGGLPAAWSGTGRTVLAATDRETRLLSPRVVPAPGGFRLYYSSGEPDCAGRIRSAFSLDGLAWTREPGVRVEPAPGESRVLSPEVVLLKDGGMRMYFQARPESGPESGPDTGPDAIRSALSGDGLAWRREDGIRLAHSTDRLGSPCALPLPNGGWRLYTHCYEPAPTDKAARREIRSAVSVDGLNFEFEPGVRVGQEDRDETYAVYAPDVFVQADGSLGMYYAAWTAEPLSGRIRLARSRDGLAWTKDEEPILKPGGPGQEEIVSEPSLALLPDGPALFYEARSAAGVWNIRATDQTN